MDEWYERLRSRVPKTPIVRELIESVERLPGLNSWTPADGLENRWTDLIAWGFVLWRTRTLVGADLLQRRIASEILTSDRPTPDTFAELSAAGLCVGLGAISGEKIPEGKDKTADWRMVWPENTSVDLEVTVARQKEKHLHHQALANELATTLLNANRDFDLVIHLSNPSLDEDREAIRAIAHQIKCGQTDEVLGRWHLRAQEITREPTVLFIAGADPRPPWWSKANARCFVLHGQIAGPDTRRAPPQVRVFFGVPYDSYINPVMRKADYPQGEAGCPFIVAVDISSLPGAFHEMPLALAGFLPLWNAVSGILLFEDMWGFERVGWQWRLIRNSDAIVPLPDTLCSGRTDLPETMETGVKLIHEGKENGVIT